MHLAVYGSVLHFSVKFNINQKIQMLYLRNLQVLSGTSAHMWPDSIIVYTLVTI